MENNVQRRIDTLSRHLLLPPETDHRRLRPILLRGEPLRVAKAEPVVIGGMVLDIHATPSTPAKPKTTTPGTVCYVLGGVARNIAECMSKFGKKPFMISAVGFDMAGNLLLEHWKSAGLSMEGIRKGQDIMTAVVCNIFDNNGEVAAGVASVEVIEKFLTPEWINLFKYNICSAPVLMVDANLSPHALETSCKMAAESGIPVWFEPVSVAKSRRVASVVKYITFASPNEDELISMANALSSRNMFGSIQKYNTLDSSNSVESLLQFLQPAIRVLLEEGIEIVMVTLGSNGVFLCSKSTLSFMKIGLKRTNDHGFSGELYKSVNSSCPPDQSPSALQSERSSKFVTLHFPAIRANVQRLTGAGDCLVGGTISALLSGLNLAQSVAVGIAAAKAAVESETNVPSKYNLATISDDAGSVYSAAKVLSH